MITWGVVIIVLGVLVGWSLYTDGRAVTLPLFIIDLPIYILHDLWPRELCRRYRSYLQGHPSRTGQTVEARRRDTPWPTRLGARPAPSPRKNFNTARNAQLWKDGRIVSRRPTRVLRNKRENIYIGTWNVLTMLKPGRMQEVAEQILQTDLQVVALQEIRWEGQGQI